MKFHVPCLLSLRSIAVLIFSGAAFVHNSDAAMLLSFEEAGGDVTVTISGSVDLVGMIQVNDDTTSNRGFRDANVTSLIALGNLADGGSYDQYGGATFDPSGYSMVPTSDSIVESFGYSASSIFVPGSVPLNGIYTPATGMSFTWVGQTLSSIGLGSLTSTPLTVWNNPGASGTDGSIQLVAVPEPSAGLLVFLSCAVLMRRRRA